MQAIGFRMPDDRDVGDGITSALTLCFLPRDFPVEPRRRHGAGSWQTYLAETADKWRRLTATAPSPTDGSLGCVDRSNSPSMSQETEDQACRLGDWQRGRDVELLAVSRRWHTIVWPAWPKPMVQVRPHDSVVFRAGALFVSRSTCPKALCCVGRSKSAGRRQFAVDEASNGQDRTALCHNARAPAACAARQSSILMFLLVETKSTHSPSPVSHTPHHKT